MAPPSSSAARASFKVSITAAPTVGVARPWSEPLAQAGEERAPDAELRRPDADAGAVAQLVFLVEQIEDVDPRRQVAEPLGREAIGRAEVGLEIGRQALGVGEAAPQPAAHDG